MRILVAVIAATVILFALIAPATAMTYVVDAAGVADSSEPNSYSETLDAKTGQVVLANGQAEDARRIAVSSDSVSWVGRWTGEGRTVPLTEVESIKIYKTARGAAKGLLWGAGVGPAVAVPPCLSNPGATRIPLATASRSSFSLRLAPSLGY